jgi:putative tricarboxylic transport membrane protein
VFLLLLGFFAAPRISRVITVPRRLLLPIVTVLCVIGAFADNNRMFDVALMLIFGALGFLLRRRGYSVGPMTLGLVLGGMMDSQFRRAVSLAVSEDNFLAALLGRPITLILLALTLFVIVSNIPAVKKIFARVPGRAL